MNETLNFKPSMGINKLIIDLAREQILIHNNIEKAIETIVKSINCSRDIAKDLLIGNKVLIQDKDNSSNLFVEDYSEEYKDLYPSLDLNNYIEKLKKDINEDAESLIEDLEKDIKPNFHITLYPSLNYSSLFKFILTEDFDYIVEEDEYLDTIYYFCDCYKTLKKKYEKTQEFIYNINTNFPNIISKNLFEKPEYYNILEENIKKLLEYTKNSSAYYISPVLEYLNKEKEIEEVLEKGIKECNILNKYNAGWLSPEGKFYGLNGEIANMLHIKIADSLYEQGIIKYENDSQQPDTWLSFNGWVKIHNNWILFDGYLMKDFDLGYFKLTEAQINKIIEYGNECYNGVLLCGTSRNPITVNRLKSLNQEQLAEIFN